MNRPSVIHKSAADPRLRPPWTDDEGERSLFSWETARRALPGLNVGKGDRLLVLAGRLPELYIAVLSDRPMERS